MSKALPMLGLTRRAGKLETGEEATGECVRGHKAKLILLAADASPNAERRARGYATSGNVPLAELSDTKAEISAAVGKPGCSMLAITDAGLAAAVLRRIEDKDYESLAQSLEVDFRRSAAQGKSGKRRK